MNLECYLCIITGQELIQSSRWTLENWQNDLPVVAARPEFRSPGRGICSLLCKPVESATVSTDNVHAPEIMSMGRLYVWSACEWKL